MEVSNKKIGTKCAKKNVIDYKNLLNIKNYLITVIKTSSFNALVRYMYKPTDPSSLGVIRIFFGLLMLIDIVEERGGTIIDIKWGDPKDCHFPLFSFLSPPSYPYMSIIYGLMWLGSFGIMLGYKFRFSVILFAIPYWYLVLLDKSFWNNHSYLFGVVAVLLMGSSANNYWSIDAILDVTKRNAHVPQWNYFILKFQFFILYFFAGLKKTDFEWLEGYSMTNLGTHWVFFPFQLILSIDQIDYLVVHWFGFLLDLTIGFWMLLDLTRPVAIIFCAMFHLMNSRLFSIGMFPYMCLSTLPLFCAETWPKNILRLLFKIDGEPQPSKNCLYKIEETKKYKDITLPTHLTWKHKLVVALLIGHCGLQVFLPYSHFVTKGFNNWTNGLYGYSWDMMVHSWNTVLVVVKVVDNNTGKEQFINSEAWTQNERWNKHADMNLQYAQCLKNNLISEFKAKDNINNDSTPSENILNFITSENISIYIDVWCSMNGRFQQRMFDPNYDLLKANWSPFKPVEWLLPLLSELNDFREKMREITEEVYSWSNYSDVLFIADFPGLYLENFINSEVKNVSLTVLEGDVVFEVEDPDTMQSSGVKLHKGDTIPIQIGFFHKIHTIGSKPSCYMYTYGKEQQDTGKISNIQQDMYSPFPMIEDVQNRFQAFFTFTNHLTNSLMHLLFNKPLNIRKRITKSSD